MSLTESNWAVMRNKCYESENDEHVTEIFDYQIEYVPKYKRHERIEFSGDSTGAIFSSRQVIVLINGGCERKDDPHNVSLAK